jgi:hypothetical protein
MGKHTKESDQNSKKNFSVLAGLNFAFQKDKYVSLQGTFLLAQQ